MLAMAAEVWREHRWAFIYPDLHHPRAQTETTLTLGGRGGHDHHCEGWAFIYPIPVLLNICFVPCRLCGLNASDGHYVCELYDGPRTNTHKNCDIGKARGTTTIAKERRRFNRYRYYSILGLFHVECAGSTALMATTSVNCMMDSGQIPTTANTT